MKTEKLKETKNIVKEIKQSVRKNPEIVNKLVDLTESIKQSDIPEFIQQYDDETESKQFQKEKPTEMTAMKIAAITSAAISIIGIHYVVTPPAIASFIALIGKDALLTAISASHTAVHLGTIYATAIGHALSILTTPIVFIPLVLSYILYNLDSSTEKDNTKSIKKTGGKRRLTRRCRQKWKL